MPGGGYMDNMRQVELDQGGIAVSERWMSWIKSASVVLHNPGKVRQQQGTIEARAIQVGEVWTVKQGATGE